MSDAAVITILAEKPDVELWQPAQDSEALVVSVTSAGPTTGRVWEAATASILSQMFLAMKEAQRKAPAEINVTDDQLQELFRALVADMLTEVVKLTDEEEHADT